MRGERVGSVAPSDARSLLIPIGLAAAIATAYANGLHGPFVFDDWHPIEQNQAIRSLGRVPAYFVDPSTTSALRDNWDLRPLLVTSFAVNYRISGLEPWSYHVVNLLLHWLAALLVYRIVRDHLWLGDEAVPVAAAAHRRNHASLHRHRLLPTERSDPCLERFREIGEGEGLGHRRAQATSVARTLQCLC